MLEWLPEDVLALGEVVYSPAGEILEIGITHAEADRRAPTIGVRVRQTGLRLSGDLGPTALVPPSV